MANNANDDTRDPGDYADNIWNLIQQSFERAEQPVLVLDTTARIVTYCNQATQTFFGYDQALPLTPSREWSPAVSASLKALFEQAQAAVAARTPYQIKLTLQHHHGETVTTTANFITLLRFPNQNQQVLCRVDLLTEQEHSEQLRVVLLETLGVLAADFLASDDWEQQMPLVLLRLGQALETSRVELFEITLLSEAEMQVQRRFDWAAVGTLAQIFPSDVYPMTLPVEGNAPLIARLRQGRAVQIWAKELSAQLLDILKRKSAGALPAPEWSQASFLTIPVFVEQSWWGVLVLSEYHTERHWSPGKIKALETAVSIIGLAMTRSRAIRDLLVSQAQLQAQFAHFPSAIFLGTEHGQIVDANPAACELLGYSLAELRRLTIFDFTDPTEHAFLANTLEQLVTTGYTDGLSVLVHRNEQRIHTHLRGVANILPGLHMTIAEDVTPLRQVEAERQHYTWIVEQASDAIIATDQEFNIVTWNHAAEKIYGWQAHEVAGQNIKDVLHSRLNERVDPDQALKLLKREQHWAEEFIQTARDGSRRHVISTISGVNDSFGRPIGYVEIHHDVTALHRSQEELARRNRELNALLQISQFIANQVEPEELWHHSTQAVIAGIPAAEAAIIWRYDTNPERLTLRDVAGFQDASDLRDFVLYPLVPSLRQAMATGTGQILNNLKSRPGYRILSAPALNTVVSTVVAPIWYEDQHLGLLSADSFTNPTAFEPNDLRLLQGMANQIGLAIHSTRQFATLNNQRHKLAKLARQFIGLQEVERRHLARELHDEIGQSLTALKLMLEIGGQQITGEAPQKLLTQARQIVAGLMSQVRELSLDLRPAELDDLGLVAALRWHFERYTDRTAINVDFDTINLPSRLAADLETTAFRLVQEGLTNVARHAAVNTVYVGLAATGRWLTVTIFDEGRGFKVDEVLDRQQTVGLVGMIERVELLGGTLKIRSAPGSGTHITARLPLSAGPTGAKQEKHL